MLRSEITEGKTIGSMRSNHATEASRERERLEEIDRIAYEWMTKGDTVRSAKALALKKELAKKEKGEFKWAEPET